jgi:tetratricopeptide (TPR) repeat protein
MRNLGAIIVMLFPLMSCATASGPVTPPPQIVETSVIDFLEQRVASDPDDYTAWNRLGNTYLRALRVTGNHDYLDHALRAGEASLRASGNRGGLLLLARARQANHQFAEARDLARTLIENDANDAEHWALLTDALLELGDYEEGMEALERMRAVGGASVGAETRSARVAILHGRSDDARSHLQQALVLARSATTPQPETVAWCEWQLGELAFGRADYGAAAVHFDAARAAYPASIPAIGAKARLLTARGDLKGAIALYEIALALDPVPPFVAAVADLYRATGNRRRADELMSLIVENAASPRDYRLDRRHLSTIYADRDIRLEEAYALAVADFKERTDIYAADTLAWAAFKTNRLDEARRSIALATRLGTADPKILYHAGMIANTAGEKERARELLKRALTLNPEFDFLQARVARRTLQTLE